MIIKDEHKIGVQEFQISLANEKKAHEIQSGISSLQETKINALLNEILDRFDNNKFLYQFNKIELNLGAISTHNYENEIIYKLEEALINFFNKNILDNGAIVNGKRIDLHNKKLEELTHFLLHGHFNWDSAIKQSPANLVKDLILEHQTEFTALLKSHGKNEIVRKRMVLQFDEDTLESIVRATTKEESNYIISYKENTFKQQKNELVDTSLHSFRNTIWEIILTYIFVDSNGYYNKKNFLQYLIKRASARYNLTYTILLDAIAQGVNLEIKTQYQHDFKKIVLELKTEDDLIQTSSKKILANDNDLNDSEFLKLVNSYLYSATLPVNATKISKETLNKRLLLLIQLNPNIIKKLLIDHWLYKPNLKKNFLTIANKQLINKCTQLIANNFTNNIIEFIEFIYNNSSAFSASSKTLINNISNLKFNIVLNIYSNQIQTLEQSIKQLLKQLANESISEKNKLHKLLEDSKTVVPQHYNKIITQFLANEYKNLNTSNLLINNSIIEDISKSIENFTSENEIEVWYFWFQQEFPNWLTLSKLKSNVLVKALKKHLKHKISATQIIPLLDELSINHKEEVVYKSISVISSDKSKINFQLFEMLEIATEKIITENPLFSIWSKSIIELLKNIENKYRTPYTVIFEAFLNNLKEKSEKQELYQKLIQFSSSKLNSIQEETTTNKSNEDATKNVIQYILSKGKLPWWKENYSSINFNHDFKKIWGNVNIRKELINTIQKYHSNSNIEKLFDKNNLILVLNEINNSSENNHLNKIIIDINNLITTLLLPSNLITTKEYTIFREKTFQLLLAKKPTQQKNKLLINFVTKWFKSIYTKNDVTSDLFISTILKSTLKDPKNNLNNELNILLETIKKQSLTKVKNKETTYIYELLKKEKFTSNDELKDLILHKPQQINHLFNQSLIRASILERYNEVELSEIISTKLSTPQKHFFKNSLIILNVIKSHITLQKYKLLYNNFFELLFLQVSNNKLSTWNESNWTNLLFYNLTNILGDDKTLEIILKVNSETSITSTFQKGIEIIEDIHKRILLKNTIIQENNSEKIDKPYKKLGAKEPKELLNPTFIQNAGVIIIAPYLGMLFEKCNLLKNGVFIDEQSIFKAIHLITYACTGNTHEEENEQVINKILCGINTIEIVDRSIELTKNDMEITDSLLVAVTQQWDILKGTSIDGLRTSFLQRNGKVVEEENQYYLKVEEKSFDMLLDQIPWNISKIKLSWMQKVLEVAWR